MTEMGNIDFEGNSNGAFFSNKQGTYQNSIIITSMSITLEDYEKIFSLSEQNVIFKDGSVCGPSNGTCFNQSKGTSIWNLKSEENLMKIL